MHLHHCNTVIEVNDKTRQPVSFSMNQPEHINLWVVYNTHSSPVINRQLDPFPEKVNIRGFLFKGKHSDSNRAGLIMSNGKKLILIIIHIHKIAFNRFTIGFFYRSRKYPRMEPAERLFFAGFKDYFYSFLH